MTKYYLIDTNIWHYAYVKPAKEEFQTIHSVASLFLKKLLSDPNSLIAITSFQIAELMDLLRKQNLSTESRDKIFNAFKKETEKFLVVDIDFETLEECFRKSLASGIHIYDYLVAIPLKGIVTEIFSADDHFQHKDFQEIAKVTNPLAPWVLREGRIPTKGSTQRSTAATKKK